jgi:hypothetical protein
MPGCAAMAWTFSLPGGGPEAVHASARADGESLGLAARLHPVLAVCVLLSPVRQCSDRDCCKEVLGCQLRVGLSPCRSCSQSGAAAPVPRGARSTRATREARTGRRPETTARPAARPAAARPGAAAPRPADPARAPGDRARRVGAAHRGGAAAHPGSPLRPVPTGVWTRSRAERRLVTRGRKCAASNGRGGRAPRRTLARAPPWLARVRTAARAASAAKSSRAQAR